MAGYFEKIEVRIFHPEFDSGYHKKIASIQYQVGYQDLQGGSFIRAEGMVHMKDGSTAASLQLASWRPGTTFDYVSFNFMKPEKPGANLTVIRKVYYNPPDKSDTQQITINTDGDDAGKFKVITQPPHGQVHNKVTVAIGDIGVQVPATVPFFQTTF